MSQTSSIEWTDATWNPVTGCTTVSPGCDHCYAKTFAERFRGTPGHHFERGFDVTLRPDKLTLPWRWRRPRRIFVNSMSDLFHADVSDAYIATVFGVMALAGQHTFQVLTKRHARMRSLLTDPDRLAALDPGYLGHWIREGIWPLPNVWLGVSVETQQWADIRIPALLDTPAAVRFVSAEPLLGPVDLDPWLACEHLSHSGTTDSAVWECGECRARIRESADPHGDTVVFSHEGPPDGERLRRDVIAPGRLLDWVIAGGESGPGARPMHADWVRGLRDQCQASQVPFLFKQWGVYRPGGDPARPATWVNPDGTSDSGDIADQVPMVRVGKHAAGRVLDGRTWDEFPAEGKVTS